MNIKAIINLYTKPDSSLAGIDMYRFRLIFDNDWSHYIVMSCAAAVHLAQSTGIEITPMAYSTPNSYKEWEHDYDNGAAAAMQEYWEEAHINRIRGEVYETRKLIDREISNVPREFCYSFCKTLAGEPKPPTVKDIA